MTKNEFLERLKNGLSGLSESEIAEQLSFYGEMIDDRIEEVLSEEEAIEGVGIPENIALQIMQEHVGSNEKLKRSKKLTAWEIVLLVLGSPIWLSLLIAVFVVIFAVYVVLWSAIASFWAIAVSFIGVALGSFIASGVFLFVGNILQAIAMLGLSIFSIGSSILGIIGCCGATKGGALLTKKSVLWMISLFKRRENRI